MGRRRVVVGPVLVVLAAGAIAVWVAVHCGSPHLTGEVASRIEDRMTPEEVAAVLGRPPDEWREQTELVLGPPDAGGKDQWICKPSRSEFWEAGEAIIGVVYEDGRVTLVNIDTEGPLPSFWQKLWWRIRR